MVTFRMPDTWRAELGLAAIKPRLTALFDYLLPPKPGFP